MNQIGFSMGQNEEKKTVRITLNSVMTYLNDYTSKTGRFPRKQTIAKSFKISEDKASEALEKLEKLGKVKNQGTHWELLNVKSRAELNRAKSFDDGITSKELTVTKKVVTICALLIAVILAGLSIRFTYLQYKDVIGWFWGLLASVAIVGTLLLSYQVKLILMIRRKTTEKHYVNSILLNSIINKIVKFLNPQIWLFRIIFFTALGISISSTIFTQVGNVLKNREFEKIESSSNQNNNLIYNNLINEVAGLKAAIVENDKNRTHYRNESAKAVQNSQAWKDANWWLNRYEKEAKELTTQLKDKNTEVNNLLASDLIISAQTDTYEIYDWLEKVTGKSKRFFELFLAVLFAIFIDIAAPLLMSVALITRRK